MGKVRKALRGTDPYARFESGTETETLFAKKGWIDFLYRRLSAFSHARPFFTDEDGNRIPTLNMELWGGSNGPVYESRSVRMWSVYYFDVAICCLLLVGLAEPRLLTINRPTDITFSEFVRRVRRWHEALAQLHPVTQKMIGHFHLE